jgi:hypothetical protein
VCTVGYNASQDGNHDFEAACGWAGAPCRSHLACHLRAADPPESARRSAIEPIRLRQLRLPAVGPGRAGTQPERPQRPRPRRQRSRLRRLRLQRKHHHAKHHYAKQPFAELHLTKQPLIKQPHTKQSLAKQPFPFLQTNAPGGQKPVRRWRLHQRPRATHARRQLSPRIPNKTQEPLLLARSGPLGLRLSARRLRYATPACQHTQANAFACQQRSLRSLSANSCCGLTLPLTKNRCGGKVGYLACRDGPRRLAESEARRA